MGKVSLGFHGSSQRLYLNLFRRLQGILTRKDIIRLMHEANVSRKFEE